MKITIDQSSGFCFGVVRAISTAEEQLTIHQPLYCLGDIVHNGQEVNRLAEKGLITINHSQLDTIHDTTVLLRAHGEPPSTYQTAEKNNIRIIDATCPVVLQLQQKIKRAYRESPNAQIVIYGKKGHAEVIGLQGQTDNTAIVVENIDDVAQLDFSRPIILFSQTTKSIAQFNEIVERISQLATCDFKYHDTICRQVANRIPNIREFAKKYDIIIFVSGQKSSNGKILFQECLAENPNTHLVSDTDQLQHEWFTNVDSVGICGATSTPKWLMEKIANQISTQLFVPPKS